MEERDVFDDLGFGVNNRFNEEYGFFDTLSLSASYSFSYKQYLRDKSRSTPDKPLTELLKTTLHETTHLYQMLTTPYGLYYYTLKLVQTDIVRHLISMLRQKYKIEPKVSLINSCRKIKSSDKGEIKYMLHGWTMAELMVLYLEGDIDKYEQLLISSSLLNTAIPMNEYFEQLECFVTIFLNSNGKPCPTSGSLLENSETSLMSEFLYLGLKSLSFPDTRGVMESWGKVAEYWVEQHRPLSDCTELFPPVIESELVDYLALLHWGKDAISAQTVGEFILSYMALCEIALSPPILPYYQSFRHDSIKLQNINPVQRILDLFTAVKGVKPIHNLEDDYVRFVQEVCSKLRWPTPIEIARSTLNTLKFPPNDKLFSFYMKAQEFRSRIPHIFLDLGVWFLPERTYTREFYYYFSHPVIEFEDRVGLHPDPDVYKFFVEQALINIYIRKLLLTSDRTVTFPYKASQSELDYFTGLLKSDLEIILRTKSIEVTLINPC